MPCAQIVGGRNGYGAKLANIFSTEFAVETCDGARSGRKYKQVFNANMTKKGAPKVRLRWLLLGCCLLVVAAQCAHAVRGTLAAGLSATFTLTWG